MLLNYGGIRKFAKVRVNFLNSVTLNEKLFYIIIIGLGQGNIDLLQWKKRFLKWHPKQVMPVDKFLRGSVSENCTFLFISACYKFLPIFTNPF